MRWSSRARISVSILPACLKEEVRPAWTKDGKEEELEEQ
jgi:hypothetical protein